MASSENDFLLVTSDFIKEKTTVSFSLTLVPDSCLTSVVPTERSLNRLNVQGSEYFILNVNVFPLRSNVTFKQNLLRLHLVTTLSVVVLGTTEGA